MVRYWRIKASNLNFVETAVTRVRTSIVVLSRLGAFAARFDLGSRGSRCSLKGMSKVDQIKL